LKIVKVLVDDVLKRGVVRPSKSPYAGPEFLVPKAGGDFRIVVDYCKINAKIIFDSYPSPTIDQAYQQFAGAVVFSVLDLNFAHYRIPLSPGSRWVAAFCTPFGLYEFNK
jgi:hypothetical protein